MNQKELEDFTKNFILQLNENPPATPEEMAEAEAEWEELKKDEDVQKLLQFAKALYNLGVADSAESAKVYYDYDCDEQMHIAEIDKQSILKNLIP